MNVPGYRVIGVLSTSAKTRVYAAVAEDPDGASGALKTHTTLHRSARKLFPHALAHTRTRLNKAIIDEESIVATTHESLDEEACTLVCTALNMFGLNSAAAARRIERRTKPHALEMAPLAPQSTVHSGCSGHH